MTTQPNPYAPPQAEVQDAAEGIENHEAASRGVRLGAALLDGIIAMLFFIPTFIIIGMNSSGVAADSIAANPLALLSGLAGVALLGGLIAWGGINWYLVAKNGQSIAKKICGIKVVRSDGSRATVARIFWLRNVVNGIPSVIPLIGNLYPLMDSLFIFNDRRQCLHDKIADTVVVRA